MTKPKMKKDINTSNLKKIVQDYVNYVASREYHEDNDYEYYIFETAMDTFYDKNIWEYINSKI